MTSLQLPTPDPDAQAHSERLTRVIRDEMQAAGGSIAFDRFMELALYAPGLGYYVAGSRKLGEEGDFVTAPEISGLFGRKLAQQFVELRTALGGADILEFGAGSGSLAKAMLDELQALNALPEAYYILDTSPELRARQQELLVRSHGERLCWLDAPPEGFRGLVLANEVLDAMPVHRFGFDEGRLFELHVTWENGAFKPVRHFTPGDDLIAATQALAPGLPDTYNSEINLRAAPWVRSLAGALEAGLILLIDYGYPETEYYLPERDRGTLMCHYRHLAHPDPYKLVGLQDITAYVDFTRVARAGLNAGLSLAGYATQAHFLLGCGIEKLMMEMDPAETLAHMQAVQGMKRLMLPGEMGERFQVLGLSRNLPIQPMGFSLRDLSGRLGV